MYVTVTLRYITVQVQYCTVPYIIDVYYSRTVLYTLSLLYEYEYRLIA